jgi:hypothetical protein
MGHVFSLSTLALINSGNVTCHKGYALSLPKKGHAPSLPKGGSLRQAQRTLLTDRLREHFKYTVSLSLPELVAKFVEVAEGHLNSQLIPFKNFRSGLCCFSLIAW